MKLNGTQIDELCQALEEAYSNEARFKRLIRTTFDVKFGAIAAGDSYQDRIYSFVEDWIESKDYEYKLIRAARCGNPSNAQMKALYANVVDFLIEDGIKEAIAEKTTDFSEQDIQTLVAILQDNSLPFEKIESAGLSALPDGVRDNLADADYADFRDAASTRDLRLCGFLHLALSKYPKTTDQELTLLRFAEELLEALGNTAIALPLSNWVQQRSGSSSGGSSGSSLEPTPQRSHRPHLQGRLQVSLMITTELLTKSTSKKSYYLVKGFLHFDKLVDTAQPATALPPLHSLSLPEIDEQIGVECDWSQVSGYVARFFDEAIAHLKRQRQTLKFRRYDLSIELFLPLNKLGEPVDQWPCGDVARPIGIEHGVIVRIGDRLQNDIRLNRLYEAWDRLQEHLQPPISLSTLEAHVEPLQDHNDYSSYRQLENALRGRLGLKLCCGLPSRSQDKAALFRAVFYSDTPVAVWTRTCAALIDPDANEPLDISVALLPFLETDGIKDPVKLASKLTEARHRAWTEAENGREEECLGDHLAFLLDNPDRLPLPALLS